MELAPWPLNHMEMAQKVISRLKPEPRYHHFIKAWRKYRNLTQERLAERINMAASSISQLETGKQDYTQATLEALADALTCSPGDLLMRNPLDTEAIWSIWEKLKPPQKRQAIELLRVLTSEDRAA